MSSIQLQETFTLFCIATATKWPILSISVCVCIGEMLDVSHRGIKKILCFFLCAYIDVYKSGVHFFDCMFMQAWINVYVAFNVWHTTQPFSPFDFGKRLVSRVYSSVSCVNLSLLVQTKDCFCRPLIRQETKVALKAAVSLMASCKNVLPQRQAFSCGDLGVNLEGRKYKVGEWGSVNIQSQQNAK